ncbi:GUN4 domain-containing protein [Iningainema tapete]|uniref:GUN4 domain-containing protein n=1 Tax=Iningainema tapete BLCC-T55 TaxID=2748662 RepID=A0A8J7BWT6_9CYAN|nr:GUN4 domain-containing protein [Iningainema tapete]MBD2772427.1 GUN4 domain-containing protein [Iningainema tapete BLCC-T55]
MQNNNTQTRKILLLSANPKGTSQLRLDEEMREIKEGLRRSKKRDLYLIDTAEAVRYRDIHRAILDYEPHIIHFCGHGAGEEGLAFEDETGQIKLVDAKALADLFQLFADQVECVVLNACYSKYQAEEISRYIQYVVGMNRAIQDKAAIEFAVGFYDALGAGRNYEFAYKLGCNAILRAGIPQNLIPQLLPERKNSPTEKSPHPGSPINTPSLGYELIEVREAAPAMTPEFHLIKEEHKNEKALLHFQQLLDLKEADVAPIKAQMLAQCRIEEQPAQISTGEAGQANKKDKQEIEYTRLRDLLKSGQLREADEETALLMQKIAGRKKQAWVDKTTIKNFPCAELNTIDCLWLEYSKDRFGLSVQQQIFVNVNHNWDEFGERVGWCGRKGWFNQGEIYWKPYAGLSFSSTAPVGHLPILVVWEWRENLLSRLQTCQQEL